MLHVISFDFMLYASANLTKLDYMPASRNEYKLEPQSKLAIVTALRQHNGLYITQYCVIESWISNRDQMINIVLNLTDLRLGALERHFLSWQPHYCSNTEGF